MFVFTLGAVILGLFPSMLHAQVHLAIGPSCGSATGTVTDINEGLLGLTSYKTIVSFGDSYTSGGKADGTKQPAAVLDASTGSPKAGGRTTNGPVWIEDVATDIGATFMDYAVGGAVTNVTLWPSKSTASDFITQVKLFLSQKHTLDPATTLYTVFFGINDYSASKTDGNKLPQAAQTVLDQIALLSRSPTNARYFLVTDDYGRGSTATTGDAYKQKIYDGLRTLRAASTQIGYAFADFKYIWNGVLGTTPGYQAFGYTSSGACTQNSSSVADLCSAPATTFYWIPGHPSKETHRIMGDYAKLVLSQC